jgi:hypothetical protein
MRITIHLALVLAVAIIMTACGGGNSTGNTTAASTGGSNSSVPGNSGIRIRGVAAVGYPIVGGTVNIKCASGAFSSAFTDNTGTFSINSNGPIFPCLLQITGGQVNNTPFTGTLTSAVTAAGVANITPLTDLTLVKLFGHSTQTT